MIDIHTYGNSALLINFDQRIDRGTHQQVLAMQHELADVKGIRYMIPAYCSLTVAYDSTLISAGELQAHITHVSELPSTWKQLNDASPRMYEIPVCYDGEFGPDLIDVAGQTGKKIEDIIEKHLSTEFYVYMVGFMPGFAYMGDMPPRYACHRKQTPRTRVPPGSVGLSGRQTGIYPFETPGGWQIIGRTPMAMFESRLDQPALLSAGDRVKFVRVSIDEFMTMRQE